MYDIVKIEARRYGFLVADVSGHGVPSALITTMLKAVYSYNAKPDRSVAEIARCVNAEMVKLIADIEQYYTAFFAMLDLERRTLTYTNAGHHPALFKRAGTPDITALTSEGIIGGKYTEAVFSQGEMEFLPGDSLLIFTDGIVEAQNPEGRFYGVKTLENFLRGQTRLGADEFVRALETDLDRFCEGVPAGDDRTALYVRGV